MFLNLKGKSIIYHWICGGLLPERHHLKCVLGCQEVGIIDQVFGGVKRLNIIPKEGLALENYCSSASPDKGINQQVDAPILLGEIAAL